MRRFIQDKGRNEKPQVWEITRMGNSIQMMWGQLGGKMQDTVQDFEAVNVGKKNEKSPEDVAAEAEDREILKKTRQGYREVDIKTGKFIDEASSSSIDFIHLPENLRFYKPKNNAAKEAYLTKMMENGDAWYIRKRDGMMHVAALGEDGEWRLYGSNMLINHKDEPHLPWMSRYPHIRAELEQLEVPPLTILLGELVRCGQFDEDGHEVDHFTYVGTVVKSKTPLACQKQEEGGHLGFCIWDVAYLGGECILQTRPVGYRYMELLMPMIEDRSRFTYVSMPEILVPQTSGCYLHSVVGEDLKVDTDPLEFAKAKGWEGFVVVDPNSVYGDRAVSFHGKAERPKYCGKLKPKYEADFIVRWDPKNGIGQFGKGKKKNGVGSVQAYLFDPDTGELVPIALVGGGLSDENVKAFADPALYPMVWQVEFDSWTDKGSLRFPEFVRVRDDKTLEECLLEQRPELG